MNIKKICWSSLPTVGRDRVKGQVQDKTEKAENGLETWVPPLGLIKQTTVIN